MNRRYNLLALNVWLLLAVLIVSEAASAQPRQQNRTLVINGQAGEATVVLLNGQTYIDLETLARIGNGSVSFQGGRIVLTLGASASPDVRPEANNNQSGPQFSKAFMASAIQALGTLKQWQSGLAYAVQRGVPGDGSRLFVYRDKAGEGVRLASAAATTDSDRNGWQLLSNHFSQVQEWTDKLIEARKTMGTANLSMSPDALNEDPLYRKITDCSRFLGQTFSAGTFADDPSCH